MAALGSGGLLDLFLSSINKDNADSKAEEEYFLALLDAAKRTINGQLRTPLDMSRTDDQLLVVDYAQFLWRSRASTGDATALPRSLRERINQRVFEYQNGDDAKRMRRMPDFLPAFGYALNGEIHPCVRLDPHPCMDARGDSHDT